MTVDVRPATEEPPSAAVDPEETIDLLLRHLGTRLGGLAPREAARRLQQHGPNEIRRREGPGHLRALARQFTHPLALLLWVAGALALVADLAPLAAAIVAVIVLNAAFAFVQELQAERATEALREFLPARARVRRGGEPVEVDARELAFAALVIYLPPLQDVFGTAGLGPRELLPLLAFPVIVWGSDELRRWRLRRRRPTRSL